MPKILRKPNISTLFPRRKDQNNLTFHISLVEKRSIVLLYSFLDTLPMFRDITLGRSVTFFSRYE